MRLFILVFLLCQGMHLASTAQDSLETKKFSILPVPTFGYSPETKTYLGAVALFNFDLYQNEYTRTSNASLELTYTFRKQFLVEADWNYFFNEERWFTRGRLHFSKYPDILYLNGFNLCEDCGASFDSDRYIADIKVYRKIKEYLFVGVLARYLAYRNMTGIVPEYFPGTTDVIVAGFGGGILYDSRDNILTSTKGAYVDLTWIYNQDDITNRYQKFVLDFRFYKSFTRNIVISNRLYNQFNFGREPFFDEAYVGGDQFVRGYFYGRYRNDHLSTLQSEFRVPIFWRISTSIFGGLSYTYGDKLFAPDKLLYNVGAGLRILMDKKEGTNLRLDFAIGQGGNSGFYFAFGESF